MKLTRKERKRILDANETQIDIKRRLLDKEDEEDGLASRRRRIKREIEDIEDSTRLIKKGKK